MHRLASGRCAGLVAGGWYGRQADRQPEAFGDLERTIDIGVGHDDGELLTTVTSREVLVPDGRTVLRRGDDLLVVTPRGAREATEARLRAVSQRGRLAHWLD